MTRAQAGNSDYNGMHVCPGCGLIAEWICVHESPVVIRVICRGECGTFESAYSELRTFPHFEGKSEKAVTP